MNITRLAIDKSRITFVILACVLFGGVQAYFSLSRAEDPGFPIRAATVITRFPGASPARVELLVSDKIEKKVQEIPELKNVTSKNQPGLSVVTANFRDSVAKKDLQKVFDKLRRKVEAVEGDLPEGTKPPVVNDEFGDVFGTVISITGDGYDYREIKQVADEVRDELLRIDDVAKVEIYGAQEERVFIEFDNERLSELGLSPGQMQSILQGQNILIAGGRVRAGDERYSLEPSGNFESVKDIEETLIQLPNKNVLPLREVAKVQRSYVDPPSKFYHHSGTPGLALAVAMREGGNLVDLGTAVKKRLKEVEQAYPIGVSFDIVIFQPGDVETKVNDFISNLLQAIGVVLLAMLLFLGLRTGLVVSTLIPMAMASALFVMAIFGVGLDQISLAALIIALGMLVDNAVGVAESTLVQMGEGKSAADAAVRSSVELAVPLLIASLTTSAAFLPIYLAESTVGEYTAPLFKVVTITLLCSWVLSITVIPLFCAKFLKAPKVAAEGAYNTRFYRLYRGGLLTVLRHRVVTLAVVAATFAAAIQGLGYVRKLFFPASDNPSFTVELELPTGTAIEHTREVTAKLEGFLSREFKSSDERKSGLKHWATFIGEGGPRFYLGYSGPEAAPEFSILIATATDLEAAEAVMPKVRRFVADNFPDTVATVRLRATGAPATAPVVYKIQARTEQALYQHTQEVKNKLAQAAGVTNIRDNWGQRIKKLVVHIDPARVRRAGLSNRDVAPSLKTSLSGLTVTNYREDDESIPVVLRAKVADRDDLGKLDTLKVYSSQGGRSVLLKQVADVDIVWEPAKILRRDRLKTMEVRADVEGDVTAASVNAKIVPWLDGKAKEWGPSMRWELGGEGQGSADANQAIADKLPIAALVIILLLVMQFNSLRRPFIVLMAIPLSLIGVTVGLLVADSYIGFMTTLGIISLAGIVINNAIVLIDRIKIEIEENGHPPARAIIESAQRRLRPILLTTFTTVLGLIPLWYGGGPMWEPMAISIIFGLLFSTVLTLGVVPVLYSLFFRVKFGKTAP